MRLKKLILTSPVLLLSTYVNATCPEPAFSSESLITPAMITPGNGWSGGYIISNVSTVPVKVILETTGPDGNGYTPYAVTYTDNFSSTNTPLDQGQGATLQPGELGTLTINDPATQIINVGYITWSAEACLNDALMVTYFNQYNSTYKYSSGRFHLNNGKPF